MMLCERLGYALGIRAVLLLFRPKADGGARTVSLMTTLTRLWEAVWVEQARLWKDRHARPYCWAGKAKGAADCALMVAIRAEACYKGTGSARLAACRTSTRPTNTATSP